MNERVDRLLRNYALELVSHWPSRELAQRITEKSGLTEYSESQVDAARAAIYLDENGKFSICDGRLLLA